jgi:hypothetical protein
MSKFTVLEDAAEMSMDDVLATDKTSMKNLLKEKWREVNSK